MRGFLASDPLVEVDAIAMFDIGCLIFASLYYVVSCGVDKLRPNDQFVGIGIPYRYRCVKQISPITANFDVRRRSAM